MQIKEILSQYSISQRLFGESILGLSQGSVSDLLARPKPWHMLTQKGREPFIRMKLFLEDDQAVHKLVSSQYKIAPEKLLRTGPFGGQSALPTALAAMRGIPGHKPNGHPMNMIPGMPRMPGMPGMPDFSARSLADPAALFRDPSLAARFGQDAAVAAAAAAAAAAAQLGSPGASSPTAATAPSPASSSSSSLLDRPAPILDPLAVHKKLLSQKPGGGGGTPPAPSLYEMAALTHELDTQELTRGVKEVLLTNNIGQKFFGEAVLGLSQGSVSELLSKPKLWHMLSIKGREPFIRMHLWLKDPTAVEKLQALKSERAESRANRKRIGGSALDSSSDRSSPADQSDFYNTAADSPGSSGSKKPRLIFSDEQKEALKIAFTLDPYPSTSVMEFLCQELNLEARTISNWFHNHRMRLKQQLPPGMENLPFPGREGNGDFEPVKFRLLCHQKMLELQQQQGQSDDSNGTSNPQPPPPAPSGGGLSHFLKQFGLPVPPESAGGLDLTFKSGGSGASSDDDESSRQSATAATAAPSAAAIVAAAAAISAGASRSRRKPAAPQWLRPEWIGKDEGRMRG